MKMALLAAATVGAICLGAPVTAHPHPGGGDKSERIIVMTEQGEGKEGAVRSFRINRGEGGMVFADCDGNKADIQEGTKKTRIIFCGKSGLSGEERARKLEEVRARLAQNDHMSAERRARVDVALQEAINRVRAGK